MTDEEVKKRLDDLKQHAATAKELSDVFRSFMDLTETDAFMGRASRVAMPEMVLKIIRKVAEERLGVKVRCKQSIAMQVRGYPDFMHGTVLEKKLLLMVFFFRDIGTGLVAMHGVGQEMTHFARFSVTAVVGEPNKDVFLHKGPSPTTVH
jgi:hypothetical protein